MPVACGAARVWPARHRIVDAIDAAGAEVGRSRLDARTNRLSHHAMARRLGSAGPTRVTHRMYCARRSRARRHRGRAGAKLGRRAARHAQAGARARAQAEGLSWPLTRRHAWCVRSSAATDRSRWLQPRHHGPAPAWLGLQALFVRHGARDRAITPASICPDSPVVIRDPWTVRLEAGQLRRRPLRRQHHVRTALMRSKNTCSVKLMEKVGPAQVIATAKAAGIQSKLPGT